MNKLKRQQGLLSPTLSNKPIETTTQKQHPHLTLWLFGLFALHVPLTFAETSVTAVTAQLQAAIEQGQTLPPAEIQQLSADTASVAGVDLNAMALDRLKVSEQITPETTALFGETIDLNTGAFSMQHVDVSIPGNFPIPVEFRRIFKGSSYAYQANLSIGDWQLAIPSYSTSTLFDNQRFTGNWGEGKICSGNLNPGILSLPPSTLLAPGDYWSGETLDIPGGANEKVLLGPQLKNGTRKYIKNWRYSCLTVPNASYEGVRATSPAGISYDFTVPKLIPAPPLAKVNGVGAFESVAKFHAFLLVSRVSDRFGNAVTYHYDDSQQLTKINSTDGRLIDIQYEQNPFGKSRVKQITANGQTWLYQYKNAQFAQGQDSLERVVRPDATFWQFDLAEVDKNNGSATYRQEYYSSRYDPSWERMRYWLSRIEEIQCMDPVPHSPRQGSVTHPSGAKLDVDFKWILFGRTEVPKIRTSNEFEVHANDLCFSNNAIVKKQLSQAGLLPMVWQYEYSQNKGSWQNQPAPEVRGLLATPAEFNTGDLRTTKVKAPDGSATVHVFSRRWDFTEGKEVATDHYDTDGITPLRHTERLFLKKSTEATAELWSMTGPELGWDFAIDNAAVHENYILQTKETTTEYINGIAADIYTKVFSDFNEYGEPRLVQESNNFNGKKRFTKTSFTHDLSYWLLNLPRTQQVSADGSNYTTVGETTYYASTSAYKSLPYQQFGFGKLLSTHQSYHADGNLKLQKFNLANRWIEFAQYKRGKPQQIKVPKRYVLSCTDPSVCFEQANLVVNNDGSIASTHNFNRVQTNYQYDSVGRLTLIDPVDNQWFNTEISYQKDPFAGLVQTISRGNYRKEVVMDGLYQPLQTKEWDSADEGATARYQRFVYNAYGKAVFSSHLADNPAALYGSESVYDGLQRLKSQTNTGQGDIQIEQLANNGTKMTNGRGFATTRYFDAYGQAETKNPVKIVQPEQAVTEISYNLFGNPTRVTQGGKAEVRVYNPQQQLCLTKRPETGVKAMKYNELGQLIAYAEGLVGTASSCTAFTDNAKNWISLQYDNVGSQQSVTYTDGTPAVTYNFDAQGNLLKLSNTLTTWDYGYNSQNLTEWEKLTSNGQSFVLDPTYNPSGLVQSLSYLGALTIEFDHNALGQTTQVRHGLQPLAKDVAYYPNGQLKTFTYGNGLQFRQDLDLELRPILRAVEQHATPLLGQSYQYDETNNITEITDLQNDAHSKSMIYDGLDRLSEVTESLGKTSYRYDVMGNLTSKTSATQALGYTYDPTSNLLKSISGSTYQFSYDPRGNVSHNGKRAFGFNQANQMTKSGDVLYEYDGYNRRVRQQKGSGSNYTLYNKQGQLMLRQAANTDRVFSVYMDKLLLAEMTESTENENPPSPVPNPTPSPEPTPTPGLVPELTLSTASSQVQATTCPAGEICQSQLVTQYTYGWLSKAAESCNGRLTELRYGVQLGVRLLQGLNSQGNTVISGGDGYTYRLDMTCSNAAGKTTRSTTMGAAAMMRAPIQI